MKKIIILLLLMSFIIGCNNVGIKEPTVVDYHSGTHGLEIDTLLNTPPGVVYENTEFVVGVEIKNKGAHDVSTGVIAITGLDPKYANIDKEQDTFDIVGKSPSYPEGGLEVIYFKIKNIWFPQGKETHRLPFTIVADYDYQTTGKVEVCINPELFDYVKPIKEVCEVTEINVGGGQGGPLAITKITPSISLLSQDLNKNEVRFGIEISNEEQGEVIGDLFLEKALLGNKKISCTNIRKQTDKKKWWLSCSTELEGSGDAYVSPLTITFNYRYRSRLNKEVQVKTVII